LATYKVSRRWHSDSGIIVPLGFVFGAAVAFTGRPTRQGGAAGEQRPVESAPHDDRSDGSLIATTFRLTETKDVWSAYKGCVCRISTRPRVHFLMRRGREFNKGSGSAQRVSSGCYAMNWSGRPSWNAPVPRLMHTHPGPLLYGAVQYSRTGLTESDSSATSAAWHFHKRAVQLRSLGSPAFCPTFSALQRR
jgi:hypothetical protein